LLCIRHCSYEYGSDDGYNDSDQCSQDDEAIEIENFFYEADDMRQDRPAEALTMYEKVITLEGGAGEEVKWRFKALEYVVTLHFRLNNQAAMVPRYREMLGHMASVTRNECTDSINSVLDTISSSTDLQALSQMYQITLDALKNANNERLWFNTNVKLGKLYLELEDFAQLQRIIDELHSSCTGADGKDDPAKGTYLLEVYAMEIQLCTATKNGSKMKDIYPKTLKLDAAISDPRIMGVIREEGGKMYVPVGRGVGHLFLTDPGVSAPGVSPALHRTDCVCRQPISCARL
jgi:COP9 signalosome complex subunit 2